jgi:hypothetical protein
MTLYAYMYSLVMNYVLLFFFTAFTHPLTFLTSRIYFLEGMDEPTRPKHKLHFPKSSQYYSQTGRLQRPVFCVG